MRRVSEEGVRGGSVRRGGVRGRSDMIRILHAFCPKVELMPPLASRGPEGGIVKLGGRGACYYFSTGPNCLQHSSI